MSVETVTFVLDLYDGAQDLVTRGMAILQPSVPVSDTTNHQAVVSPVIAYFSDSNSTVPLQFALRACDDPDLTPAGWQWTIAFVNVPGDPAGFSFFLNAAAGAAQYYSSQVPVTAITPMSASLPLPSGGTYPGGTTEFLRADQTWDVPPGTSSSAVSSVFGRTGAVTAGSGDYTASQVGADAAGAAATAQATAETFATSAVAAETARAEAAETLKAPLASPALTGTPTAPTQSGGDSSTKLATTAFVAGAVSGGGTVSSVFGRTGTVAAASGDYTAAQVTGAATAASVTAETTRAEAAEALLASSSALTAETARAEAAEVLLAPKASPALTGTPTVPTAGALTSTTQAASTAYADSAVGTEKTRALAAEGTNATAIAAETTRAEAAEALLVPLTDLPVSVANGGTGATSAGAARTALGLGTAATQASTAFDTAGLSAAETTRAEAAEALLAPLASPALTGTPTAPTAAALTATTQVGTTAYTDSAVAAQAAVRLTAEGLLAPKASPALTGTPTAPTASPLTSSTQVGTTAYTDSAVSAAAAIRVTAEGLLAPKASPALTGTPTAPTATALTSTTQVATTAYADSATGVEKTRALAAEAALAGGSVGGPSTAGLGLGLLSINPAYCMTDTLANNEQLDVVLATAPVSKTVTTLGCLLIQAGVTAGAGVNELAMYSEAGTLVAQTGDMTTAFGSLGYAEGAIANPGGITSYSLVAGVNYYLAFLSSFTGTVTKLASNSTISQSYVLNGHYVSRFMNSQATMPGTITPSSMSGQTSCVLLYAR